MNNILTIIGLIFLVLFLYGCTPTEGEQGSIAEVAALSLGGEEELSTVARLALGSVQLEGTELAIDAAQAEALLPLWQALQTLGQSETTATAELEALASQIEESMQAAQVGAIDEMNLTAESAAGLQDGFAGRGQPEDGAAPEGAPADGGGQGRGGLGGGGAGGPRGGGGPGGFAGGGELNEEALATRQAQFASSALGAQDLRLTGTVVRLLQQKLGQGEPTNNRQVGNVVLTAVSESIDLSIEQVREQLADGIALTEIVTAAGVEVVVVETAVREALNELPNSEQLEVEQIVSDWFSAPSE